MKNIKTNICIFLILVVILLISSITITSCKKQTMTDAVFASTPIYSNTEMFKMMDPLLKYLTNDTGIIFRQVYSVDINEYIAKLRSEEIDFSYSNPTSYIKSSLKKDVRDKGHMAFAMAQMDGKTTYHGEILIRKDNNSIKTLNDLKGKKGMLVGYTSLGGGLSQIDYCKKNGIDIRKESNLIEAPGNKQEKVVMAVYNQEVDFGFVRDGAREVAKDMINLDEIKVLFITDEYPQWVFAASTKIPKEIVDKVNKSLLKAPPEVLNPGKIDKFITCSDKEMNSMRSLHDNLNIEY